MLFVVSRILFPFGAVDTETNFREFYFRNYQKFFLIIIILITLAITQDVFLEGFGWQDQIMKIVIIIALSAIALKRWANESLHKIVVVLLLLAFAGSFAFLEYTIQ